MDIDKAKEVSHLLDILSMLNKIKKDFTNNIYNVWELVNSESGKSLIMPYILKDTFSEAVNESIKEIEQQIKEL